MNVIEKLINQTTTVIEFENHWEMTGSAELKNAPALSENALRALRDFVDFCKGSTLICRPILPSCDIDGIYKENEIYFEVDCVWSDAKETDCITVARVSKEYADQKIREVEKLRDISEPDFSSMQSMHDIYPPDYPENFVDVMINENFNAIYKRPNDKENLNPLGNFYRRKTIHNDIVRTIERLQSEKLDFDHVTVFLSDHFKIEVLVKSRPSVN